MKNKSEMNCCVLVYLTIIVFNTIIKILRKKTNIFLVYLVFMYTYMRVFEFKHCFVSTHLRFY
jgi:hypothetical protein